MTDPVIVLEQPDDVQIAKPEQIISRSLVGGVIEGVDKRPEEVTKTTMKRFGFRKPDQKIAIFYIKNKVGQDFEVEIDESTVRAMARVFDEK